MIGISGIGKFRFGQCGGHRKPKVHVSSNLNQVFLRRFDIFDFFLQILFDEGLEVTRGHSEGARELGLEIRLDLNVRNGSGRRILSEGWRGPFEGHPNNVTI